MFRKLLLGTAIGTFATLAAANATVILRYEINGGGFTTVTDNGAGDLLNLVNDNVLVTIAGFGSVHLSGGSATQNSGMAAESLHMNLTNAAVPPSQTGTIRVQVTGTGFTTLDMPQDLISHSQAAAITGAGTATYRSWADDSDAAFGMSCVIESGVTLTANGQSQNTGSSCAVSGTYSITQEILFNLASINASTGINLQMSTDAQVPEPASMTLLGAGLAGLGLLARRRRKAA